MFKKRFFYRTPLAIASDFDEFEIPFCQICIEVFPQDGIPGEHSAYNLGHFPGSIYLLNVNNRNTRRYWRRSGVFIVNFEHISLLFVVRLLLTLNM